MALVSTGLFLRVQLADNTGETVTKSYEINPAAIATLTAADGSAAITAAIAQIGAVSDGVVVGYSIGEDFREDTIIYGTGDKDAKAIVTAPIDGIVGKSANMYINAPADVVFIGDAAPGPDAEQIDPADVDLLNYVGMFRATFAAGPPVTGLFLISDGEQLSDTGVPTGYKL